MAHTNSLAGPKPGTLAYRQAQREMLSGKHRAEGSFTQTWDDPSQAACARNTQAADCWHATCARHESTAYSIMSARHANDSTGDLS